MAAAPTPNSAPAARGSSIDAIVRAGPGAADTLTRAVHDAGGVVVRKLGLINGVEARVPAGAMGALARTPGVVSVSKNAKLQLAGYDANLGYDATGDFGSLYNIARVVRADRAWAAGANGAGVDVAVVDSGVANVSGLSTNTVNGVDYSFESQDPSRAYGDSYGHGTHMAGIIAGRDGGDPSDATKFNGIAPGARVVNVKVANRDGATDVSQVIAAIGWVIENKARNGLNIRVLNLSFGTSSTQSYLLDPLAYAAEQAWKAGIVVVASVGNDGRSTNRVADPASDPFVIAVGAEDPLATVKTGDDVIPDFSARGAEAARHADVVAPGVHVLSLRSPGSAAEVKNPAALAGSRFMRGSGTSQATAVVSGAAAVMLSRRPSLTPDQVKALLMATARRIDKKYSGNGVIDVVSATTAAVPINATQTWTPSTGTGSLELARGDSHVTLNGVDLIGEQDIFGRTWDPLTWSAASWSAASWSAASWSSAAWSAASWSAASWSAASWSAASWSAASWSAASWSAASWSVASWSSDSWS
jgi:serine protease AprX